MIRTVVVGQMGNRRLTRLSQLSQEVSVKQCGIPGWAKGWKAVHTLIKKLVEAGMLKETSSTLLAPLGGWWKSHWYLMPPCGLLLQALCCSSPPCPYTARYNNHRVHWVDWGAWLMLVDMLMFSSDSTASLRSDTFDFTGFGLQLIFNMLP